MNLEYLEFSDLISIDYTEEQFDKVIKSAARSIHHTTRNFYKHHDFEEDVEWRKNAVKEALALQVEYFIQAGSSTSEGMNSKPQAVQLGRTMISQSGRMKASRASENKALVCLEAQLALSGTGLLNRGVG